jgi:UDP-N-acetylmuramyl pentapeptide phosphotransferase/UDP-N-acetylglucosamine-1-phosphate transferase
MGLAISHNAYAGGKGDYQMPQQQQIQYTKKLKHVHEHTEKSWHDAWLKPEIIYPAVVGPVIVLLVGWWLRKKGRKK